MTTSTEQTSRRVLLVAHTGRDEARDVARSFTKALTAHGIVVRLLPEEAGDLALDTGDGVEIATEPDPSRGCELVVVIGGDGTILRAAELTHEVCTPVLGVNLGHVGFLAEAEYDDLDSTIDAVVQRRYTAEDRLTLDVAVYRDGELITRTFALNEASVEKAARERMLEVVVEIDGRPLSRWGCDGVVCATPTGSTAYNFSAGGPVVWPEVEALLLVPISAHALFARPLVVGPASQVTVHIDPAGHHAVLACDGRRICAVPPGARVLMHRGERPVDLVKLRDQPFTDRLVRKFSLPVHGWRDARY